MKTASVILFLCSIIVAEHGMHEGPPPDVMDKIQTLRMWKMTEVLDLSEEQASRFFPALKEMQKEQETARQRLVELSNEVEDALAEKADTIQILGIIDEMISMKKIEAESEIKFFTKARSILSVEQQAKYVIFERDFRKKMMDLIRDSRKDGKGRKERDNFWEEGEFDKR